MPRLCSNAGIPSTCYMLLFKLYCLQLTTSQIKRLISHKDSPFIRVIGFLYLRYCCAPKELWGWCAAPVYPAFPHSPGTAASHFLPSLPCLGLSTRPGLRLQA